MQYVYGFRILQSPIFIHVLYIENTPYELGHQTL